MRLRVVPGAVVQIDANPRQRVVRDLLLGLVVLAILVLIETSVGGVAPYAWVLAVLFPLLQVIFRLRLDLVLRIDPVARSLERRFFGRVEVLGAGLSPSTRVRVLRYGALARARTPKQEWVTGWGVELDDGTPVLVVNAQDETDARLVARTIEKTLGLAQT